MRAVTVACDGLSVASSSRAGCARLVRRNKPSPASAAVMTAAIASNQNQPGVSAGAPSTPDASSSLRGVLSWEMSLGTSLAAVSACLDGLEEGVVWSGAAAFVFAGAASAFRFGAAASAAAARCEACGLALALVVGAGEGLVRGAGLSGALRGRDDDGTCVADGEGDAAGAGATGMACGAACARGRVVGSSGSTGPMMGGVLAVASGSGRLQLLSGCWAAAGVAVAVAARATSVAGRNACKVPEPWHGSTNVLECPLITRPTQGSGR